MNSFNVKSQYLFRTTFLMLSMVLSSAVVVAETTGDFWLVTPEEYLKFAQGTEPAVEMFEKSFGAPVITLVSPQIGKEGVNSPMKIELLFEATADSTVVPESFKVLYGMFKIDITDRILEHAIITNAGVVASDAKLPLGEHNMALEISDNLGRTGRRDLTLTVIE